MRKSTFGVLRVAELVFEAVGADPQLPDFLTSNGFALTWLSQGKQRVERARVLREKRDGFRRTVRATTDTLRAQYRDVAAQVAILRFAADAALVGRPDLASAIANGRHRSTGTEAPAPAPEAPAPKPARRRPKGGILAFVERSRGTLTATLGSPDALALLEPLGYTRDVIEGILSGVEALGRTEVEHERMKAETLAATQAVHAEVASFRRWFMPWRKRLLYALRGRPDLHRLVSQAA